MVKRIILILLYFLSLIPLYSKSQFIEIATTPDKVYKGQPFQVSFTVYTETYFTAGVEFEDFTIPNAIVIPFKRTYSVQTQKEGIAYAGIRFFYLIFPTASDFVIPSLNIKIQTPPPGEYVSKEMTLKSKAQFLSVMPYPQNYKSLAVGTNFQAKQSWSENISSLSPKVGDVIERTIDLSLDRTLSQFIPNINFETPDKTSINTFRPEYKDNKDTNNISGSKTFKIQYIITKKGGIKIPDIVIPWLNLETGKVSSLTIPGKDFVVSAIGENSYNESMNETLDAYKTSIKNRENELLTVQERKEKIKKTLRLTGLIILGLVLLFFPLKKIILFLSQERKKYLKSSKPLWKKFKKSLRLNDLKSCKNSQYIWYDSIRKENSPAITKKNYPLKETEVLDTILFKGNKEKIKKKKLIKEMKNLKKYID